MMLASKEEKVRILKRIDQEQVNIDEDIFGLTSYDDMEKFYQKHLKKEEKKSLKALHTNLNQSYEKSLEKRNTTLMGGNNTTLNQAMNNTSLNNNNQTVTNKTYSNVLVADEGYDLTQPNNNLTEE